MAGSVATIDATVCQKDITRQIVEAKADYVLALKGSQEKRYDAVTDYSLRQMENDYAGIDTQHHTIVEKVHGRKEMRIYTHSRQWMWSCACGRCGSTGESRTAAIGRSI